MGHPLNTQINHYREARAVQHQLKKARVTLPPNETTNALVPFDVIFDRCEKCTKGRGALDLASTRESLATLTSMCLPIRDFSMTQVHERAGRVSVGKAA